MSHIKKMSREFKIVQNTGNVSYISSAIYSTHARPERRRRKGHCKTNANAWRSSPFQNIVIPLFFSFIFVQIFSNPSTVLYPHLWWSCINNNSCSDILKLCRMMPFVHNDFVFQFFRRVCSWSDNDDDDVMMY